MIEYMSNDENINAEIKKIENILSDNLCIPNYQRPYRWTERNVFQLLEDIKKSWKAGKKSYRIGSVILNNDDNGTLNIVDGQQRITTILLVLKVLGSEVGKSLRENKLQYSHKVSLNAIIANHRFIVNWIDENISNEKDNFTKYLLQYCEFVEIQVKDLSEAFQMFDSQNGRGKELEAYNLLKAYHIRAMESNTFDEKIVCDRNWESATRYLKTKETKTPTDLLMQVINEQLYRTRQWSKKEIAGEFSKKQIDEFKGITICKNQSIDYPYQNKELLQFIVQSYFNSLGVSVNGMKSRFHKIQPKNINPFTLINQHLVNGKEFFEYIETYVEIYKQLFITEGELPEFKKFVKKYCVDYSGANRDGDKYLFELYKSLILLVFDKFGEEGVDKYYEILYLLVYRFRLEREQVKYVAVAAYPLGNLQLFHIIENARSFVDLAELDRMAYQKVECKKDVEPIIKFFDSKGIKLSSQNTQKVDLIKYGLTNGN